MIRLKKYQAKAVESILDDFKNNIPSCLSFYTGAGKTVIFMEICRRLIEENPSIKIGISAYLTTEIRDQIFERTNDFDLKTKSQILFSTTVMDSSKNIFIFNPQAVWKYELEEKLDVFIIDECHVGADHPSNMINQILKNDCKKDVKVLLVSATPWDTLATKSFENAKVYKRPLSLGIQDGRIDDFRIAVEEAQIEFNHKDFTRKGDLSSTVSRKKIQVLKSACIGKMNNILKRYKGELGEKVLVICPPGNSGEIAREMAVEFKGLAFIEQQKSNWMSLDTRENLALFKEDASIQFLFVINKCQVGFDMPELETVIDLTMSRNVKVLAQRIGRVARKSGDKEKKYIYVFDKSLRDRVDWLINTLIEFSLGEYDGWTTKTVKYRETVKHNRLRYEKPGKRLSAIVKDLSRARSIRSTSMVAMVDNSPPKHRTLEDAIKEASQYESRTDMWSNNAALYKWFRLNARDEMDRIFPLKQNRSIKEDQVIRAMRSCKSRQDFRNNFRQMYDWVIRNKREDLKEAYLPPSKSTKIWDEKLAYTILRRCRSWPHVRQNYPGARRWMYENKGEEFWLSEWEKIHGKKYTRRRGRPLVRQADAHS